MAERWSPAQTAVLAAGAVLTLVGIVGTRLSTDGWTTFFDNVHWTCSYATAAIIATLGWKQARDTDRQARAAFAFALCAYALGQVTWDFQVWSGWNPFPGPSDALFVLLGPGMCVGLLLQVRKLRKTERASTLLDMVGVFAAISALVLVLYLPRCGDRDVLTMAVLVAYPVVTLGAAVMAIVVVCELQLRLTWSLLLFLVSLFANGALWAEWNSRTLDNTLADGIALNFAFSITALIQGVSVALWRVEAHTDPRYQRVCFAASRLLPLLLVIGAAGAIVLGQRIPDVAQVAVMSAVAVVVVVAVARQSLLLREREQTLQAEARSLELESRLIQSQKLESLGTLAGGVAHDFNNILMAIYGHAQVLESSLPRSGGAREALENLLRGCERGRDLVRRVLSFSRADESERRAVDLKDVVRESLLFLRAALPTSVNLVLDAPAPEHFVHADAAQLQRVVMNLASNASDAMEGRSGNIRISLVTRVRDAGKFVELSIADDGSGMDPTTLRRVFEPFFTTKGPDRGTGLGLSVVHGIVTAHGGTIEVDSTPGQGSVFRIALPELARPAAQAVAQAAKPAEIPARGQGREVLVVDDEKLIGPILAHYFSKLGWNATVAEEPLRALSLIEAEPQRFSLVITDRTMPGMTGDILARRIHAVVARMPIVLSTGGADTDADRVEFAGVLRKPYNLAQLAAVVEEVTE